jgi:hypothetical protein
MALRGVFVGVEGPCGIFELGNGVLCIKGARSVMCVFMKAYSTGDG